MSLIDSIKTTSLACKARPIKYRISEIFDSSFLQNGKISYSQFGEDIILESIFIRLSISRVKYLDIGAHHPRYLSNTYFFYCRGGHGVCIEPNPSLFAAIQTKRPNDICLNIGVGFDEATEADFYIMSNPLLSTFSKEEAEELQKFEDHTVSQVVRLPLKPINAILEQFFDKGIDLVSIDVEGLDMAILASLDFALFRPTVFCVETIVYTAGQQIQKRQEIIDYLVSHDYFVYADTCCNSIFVDIHKWPETNL